jgi:hypothetical protein
MKILSPTEYLYLSRPYWSDGADMLKTTFQELCLKNVLRIEGRMVEIDKRDSKKRKRYFLKLNDEVYYHTQSRAESRILAIFEERKEWSFTDIRRYVKKHFHDSSDEFKYKYVLPDLKRKSFFAFSILLSKTARKEKKFLKEKLQFINKNIDTLIRNKTLETELFEIGMNIILLEKETIDKIKNLDEQVLKIGDLEFFRNENSFNSLQTFSAVGSFDQISSFDLSDAGVDFGGGDFGGAGGGGGDW